MPQATKPSEEDLHTYCAEKKREIDNELRVIITKMVPKSLRAPAFDKSLHHALLLGGKRVRPILGLATYELFRDTPHSIAPFCAVELIHAGSLMLDDLPCMDNAQYRRGQMTSHSIFGDGVTILSSASLWVEAFGILSRTDPDKSNELVRVLERNIGSNGLIQGQLLDLASFNFAQTEQELEECYLLKTGALFALSVDIGAILGDANDEEREHLRKFATNYGIAYQIRDDILDATQTRDQTGKDERKDAQNNKPTYVSLLGIDESNTALQKKVEEARIELFAIKKNTGMLELLLNQLLVV